MLKNKSKNFSDIDADQQAGLSESDMLDQLLPLTEVEQLKSETVCQFCKDKHPNPTQCYANCDIVNPKTKDFEKGAIVSLQIPCCRRCEKNFKRLNIWPTALTLFICALGLLFLSFLKTEFWLKTYGMYIPFLIFSIVAVLALGAGALLKSVLKARAAKETKLYIMKLDKVRKWRLSSWQELNSSKDLISRPVFADRISK